jgi:translation initiation factor IF-1
MQLAPPWPMNRATGTITLVQEERFQLACDDGTQRLFILAHDAPLEAGGLSRLHDEGAHVEVQYDDPVGLLAHTAHRLRKQPRHERLP